MQPSSIAIGVSQQPPPLQLLLLGLQYAFMVCVYMVIVVIVVHAAGASPETARSAVSLAMIASAIGTALQALHRGPVGSGFLAPPVFSAIYLGPSILAAKAGGLSAVACMTVCAGLTEIVVAALLLHLRIILQPAITGLTITIIALELGIVGLQHALDVGGQSSARFLDHVAVSALTFFVCVGFTIWGRGVWKLICTLTGLVAGVATALLVGLFDEQTLKTIAAAPWIAIPDPFYISFSTHVSLMPAFMAAGLAAAIRTVGVVTTCQKANDVNWNRPNFRNIRKGVFADGLACAIGGAVGAPGMNTGPSLVGVSIATGVTSRAVAFACSGVLIVLAFVPKVADILLQLPLSVAGALLVFTASIMLTSGLQLMAARPLDARFTFVIGVGLLFPLTRLVSPDYFNDLPGLHVVTNSGLALGLISAIVLLLLFRIGTSHRHAIAWKKSEDAVAELQVVLDRRGKDWNLTKAAIDRAVSTTKRTIELVNEGRLLQEAASLTARERDGSLDIEIRYVGLPILLQDRAARFDEPNEESTATGGLQSVAMDALPDRSTVSSRGPETTIRLGFDV